MNPLNAFISLFIGMIVLAVGAGFLLSYPIMLLWNGCLVPAVNGLHTISWLQAWGIMILFGFLFKSSVSTKSE